MARKRKHNSDNDVKRFVKLDKTMTNSHAFRFLSGNESKVFTLLLSQYNGKNNGNLAIPYNQTDKFMVKPNVKQTLETKPQESSEFLKRINVVAVAGTLASTTDTTQKYPEPQAIGTLDQWAKLPDFQKHIAKIKEKHMALDRIMLGFNGTSCATTSNCTANPPLQDVAKG